MAILEEVHPLKQGLKLLDRDLNAALNILEEVHPLKQGLKLLGRVQGQSSTNLEEVHPLKQGLKPGCAGWRADISTLKRYIH